MEKAEDNPPRSTWGLPCSTGRKVTILVSKIQSDLKKIHYVVGVQNQRVFVTTGGVGDGLIFKTHSVLVQQKNPFKVRKHS